jgi:hypothetical protein
MLADTSYRLLLPTAVLALVACFASATASLSQTSPSPPSTAPAAKGAPVAKGTTSPAKSTASGKTPASAKAAASSKLGALEPVRQKIYENCVSDSGDLFRSEKTTKPCDCFATTMAKAMSKEDIDFFLNYNVIPTLGTKKPAEVRKSCGVPSEADAPARSRGYQSKDRT